MSAGKPHPPELIARLVKVARENPDLTLAQLAERFGIERRTIHRLLNQARKEAA